MADEDNLLVTEVGKVNVSSADSTEELKETKKTKKKMKVLTALKTSKTSDNTQSVDGSGTLELPQDIVSTVFSGMNMERTVFNKMAFINLLSGNKEINEKATSLKEELISLNKDEIVLEKIKTLENGAFLISVQPTKEETENPDHFLKSTNLLEAVVKHPREWDSLGSEQEIVEGLVRNTRPLIELTMESRATSCKRSMSLGPRTGTTPYSYAALGPSTRAPPTLRRTRMDAAVQAVAQFMGTAAQVEPGLPVNAWTQYVYDIEGAQEASQAVGSEIPPNFKFSEGDYMNRALEYNSIFNLYTDDYPLLAKKEEEKVIPMSAPFELMDVVADVTHVTGKVVVCIAWHPMYSGVLAALYGPSVISLLTEHETPKQPPDVFARNVILLWSLKNTLQPFMVLTCPRESTVIKWCPVDENILVGACISGQVAVWDLGSGWLLSDSKLDEGEQRSRCSRIRNILSWPQEKNSLADIRPTAMSNLSFSHRGPATDLQWLNPFHRLNKIGNYEPNANDSFSMQFMTCGRDGCVLVWDLNEVPPDAQKLERMKKRQEETTKTYKKVYSRFNFYHRIMKPIFKFTPHAPTRKSKLVFTALAVSNFSIKYEEINGETEQESQNKLYDKFFKPVLAKPELPPERTVWLGTEDGVVLTAKWAGFDYDKGEDVTSEVADVSSISTAIHDGPIVCLDRSYCLPELIVSVGGHVWSIWSVDRHVVSRRSTVRLTYGLWSRVQPSVLYMARTDGTLDVWNWVHRSDRPFLEQSMSGEPLTRLSIALYQQPDGRHLLAVADYRNALDLYYAPDHIQNVRPDAVTVMRDAMLRELNIHSNYLEWNKKYTLEYDKLHPKIVKEADNTRHPVKKVVDVTKKLENDEEKKFAKSRRKVQTTTHDDEKMLEILLKKKNLDKEELMAKREPLRKLQLEEEDRKNRHKLKIKQQHEEYEKVFATLLPRSIDAKDDMCESELALQNEVRQIINNAMEEWRAPTSEAWDTMPSKQIFDGSQVLEKASARRANVETTLFSNQKREDRFAARKEMWLSNPPSPPPPLVPVYLPTAKTSLTSLAVCKPPPDKPGAIKKEE